jgi:hypothetical protein
MTVVRMPVRGQWAWDVRGEGRAARISAHAEAGLVNLSVWRHDTCVGTVRLRPAEVANLVTGLTESLAQMAREPRDLDRHGSDAGAQRLSELERRLAGLEARAAAPGWRRAASAVTAWARQATGTAPLRDRRPRG